MVEFMLPLHVVFEVLFLRRIYWLLKIQNNHLYKVKIIF